jgi:hypothetical protein
MIPLILFLAASSFHSTALAAILPYEPGQIVIKLATSSADDLLAIHRTYGTITLAVLPHHADIFLLQAPLGTDAEKLVQTMLSDARLLYAELNHINESTEDGSTDRIYGWGGASSSTMWSQNSAKSMQLESSHRFSRGAGTLVAILDTGVQSDHPALSNNLELLGYDFVDNDPAPND